MLKAFVNLLFPKVCFACGLAIQGKLEHICLSCRSDLTRANFQPNKENLIEQIFWGRLELERANSHLKFEKKSKVQHLLHALKYQGKKELGKTLGELAALEIKDTRFFEDIDLIIPVPIHKIKQQKRGYNQSHLIADGISSIVNIPIDLKSIIKKENTSSQTKKSRFKRFENVTNTFNIKNENTLSNKHLLVVDDVVTTGSTIEALGSQLKKIEGVRLSLLTIAYS